MNFKSDYHAYTAPSIFLQAEVTQRPVVNKVWDKMDQDFYYQKLDAEAQRTGIGIRRLLTALPARDLDGLAVNTIVSWGRPMRPDTVSVIRTVPKGVAGRIFNLYARLPGLMCAVSLEEDVSLGRFRGQNLLLMDQELAAAQIEQGRISLDVPRNRFRRALYETQPVFAKRYYGFLGQQRRILPDEDRGSRFYRGDVQGALSLLMTQFVPNATQAKVAASVNVPLQPFPLAM